jgi:transposase
MPSPPWFVKRCAPNLRPSHLTHRRVDDDGSAFAKLRTLSGLGSASRLRGRRRVNAQQAIVLSPRRIEWSRWDAWRRANLPPSEAVVLEASANSGTVYAQVAPLVGRAVVAPPALIQLIASARVKPAARDVLNLARRLAANWRPEVWVPPVPVRELRWLLAHRQRLVQQQTRTRHRLPSVRHRHTLNPPQGDPFHPERQAGWLALPVAPTEQLRLRPDWAPLAHLAQPLGQVDQALERLSGLAPWAPSIPFLLQLPGVGLLTAMTLLAAVGESTRFASAKKRVGDAGLGAGVHRSGQTDQGGPIPQQGRRARRGVLVEAAWRAVRCSPDWQAAFERVARRRGERRAMVAIARKRLVRVWHGLTDPAADRHAQPEQVAYTRLRWTWRLPPEQRQGLTASQCGRYQLLRRQLGDDLAEFQAGGKQRRLPPAEDVQRLTTPEAAQPG